MSEQYQTPTGTAVRVKNGRFTINSNSTGEHRTFEVKTVIADPKKPAEHFRNRMADKRILSLLTGPDNLRNYTGFAFVDDEGINVWSSKRTMQFRSLAACFWRFATEGVMDTESGRVTVEGLDGYMLCQGRCSVCNRALTVPESVESGIGPVCARRG